MYERYARKWSEFGFSFEFVDGCWCGTERRLTDRVVLAEDYTNKTDLNLPHKVSALLAKGPKYRLPPILHSKFLYGVISS